MKNLKYFILKESVDPKIVGHWPQIDNAKNIRKADIDMFVSFMKEDKFPDFIPRADSFKLNGRAKLTDLIGCKFINFPRGFVVNERFYELLSQHSLSNVRFYDIKILANKDIGTFKLIYLTSSPNLINFSHSIFSEVDIMLKPIGKEHIVSSFEEFNKVHEQSFSEENCGLKPKSIKLKEVCDLFLLPKDSYIYISEKLKQAISDANISGTRIKETTTSFFS